MDKKLGKDKDKRLKGIDNKQSLKILYAETDFELMIFRSSPLDFIIKTPDLLPPEYLLDKMADIENMMNVPRLLSWLTAECPVWLGLTGQVNFTGFRSRLHSSVSLRTLS